MVVAVHGSKDRSHRFVRAPPRTVSTPTGDLHPAPNDNTVGWKVYDDILPAHRRPQHHLRRLDHRLGHPARHGQTVHPAQPQHHCDAGTMLCHPLVSEQKLCNIQF